jgi:hypothetical protein
VQHQLHLQGLAGDPVLQRHAVQVFHHHEHPAAVFADVVQRADVRMAQSRRCPRLAPESLQRQPVPRQIVGQEFQRYESPQPRVLGLVNDAHATAAQFSRNPLVGDRGIDHRG